MHFYSKKNTLKLRKYLWVKTEPREHEKRLLEKAAKYNTYFRYIPWVLGIAICNSVAMNSAHKNSDIDLFIITKKNRLWTTRISMTLLIILLWQRKTSHNHAWKFCLSFFVSEDSLDFSDIAIKNDIYLAYWLENLIPIIQRKNIFMRLRGTNKALIQFSPKNFRDLGINFVQKNTLLTKFLTLLWDTCEKILKFIFLRKTKKSFQKLWKPFWVVISDTMLKFHNKDRRKEIRDAIISS